MLGGALFGETKGVDVDNVCLGRRSQRGFLKDHWICIGLIGRRCIKDLWKDSGMIDD